MKKIIFFIVAGITFFCCGCGKPLEQGIHTFSGTLEINEYALGTSVGGRIERLYVDEGQNVAKGELIATLDHYPLAKTRYDRLAGLIKFGAVSQEDFELAERDVKDQEIVSPVDGVVLVKVHEEGEAVSAGSAVVIIGNTQAYWVRVYVPEGMINRIHLNQSAKIRLDGLKKMLTGRVSYISPQAEFTPRNIQTPEERVSQAFAIKVNLDQPVDNLHAGVYADVLININQPSTPISSQ